MKLLATEYEVQQIYKDATIEDFYDRIKLQEKYYGKIGIKEDGKYLELCVVDWKEKGLSGRVSLSLDKDTGYLHIPYLYKTYKFK